MENVLLYHRVIPENLKDAYVEFDQIDFNYRFRTTYRALVVGSLEM